MNIDVFDDARGVALAVDSWLKGELALSTTKTLYIPAGATPKLLYDHWRRVKPAYLNVASLLQIDDVITGHRSRCFKEFLLEELRPFKEQIKWITNGDEQADLAILGLGLNGHVAFHEPGLPQDFFSGCVRLSETTIRRLDLEKDSWGITYGLGAFLNCRSIAMMVTGREKGHLLAQLRGGNGGFPALALRDHRNFKIFADREALI